jgi:threonine dehydrogenase-like Zn-dependent dehydrogenase
VYGCGLIGLLVVAALRGLGMRVVAVDPDGARRRLARALGAAAAHPPDAAPRRVADVTIECSGNPAALQGAIDGAMDAGRVVLASWYGQKAVHLSLGTRFHRSHLEIVASQVSEITGAHRARWSKGRRFGAAWDLIRAVRPASALPTLTLPLARAAEAYERLDTGRATVVLLSYGDEAAAEPAQRSRF